LHKALAITGAILAVMMYSTFECVQIFYGNGGLELAYAALGTIFFMGIFGVLLSTIGLVLNRTVSATSIIFGTVLLAMGLFASFYRVIHTFGQPPEAVILQIVYPFESVGIILLAAGVIFIALGLLHPTLKDNHISIRI
jgi:hypothetical protein